MNYFQKFKKIIIFWRSKKIKLFKSIIIFKNEFKFIQKNNLVFCIFFNLRKQKIFKKIQVMLNGVDMR